MKNKINKKQISPNDVVLDTYEQELEAALESQTFGKKSMTLADKNAWTLAAKNHIELRKSRRITLNVNTKELLQFKSNAQEKGIPYQTLISLLIKQYNSGRLPVVL